MDFTIIISDRQPKRRVGISVTYLAKKTGYSKSHISRIFSGQTTPSIRCLHKMATILNVSMDELSQAILGDHRKTRRKKPQRVIYAEPKIG